MQKKLMVIQRKLEELSQETIAIWLRMGDEDALNIHTDELAGISGGLAGLADALADALGEGSR